MGQNPSGISTRFDKARLTQDLNALKEIIEATPDCLAGTARVHAFQLLDTVTQTLKRHNMYADVRLELSIAIRSIPPRIDEQEVGKRARSNPEIYHSQALESITFLKSMLEERPVAKVV